MRGGASLEHVFFVFFFFIFSSSFSRRLVVPFIEFARVRISPRDGVARRIGLYEQPFSKKTGAPCAPRGLCCPSPYVKSNLICRIEVKGATREATEEYVRYELRITVAKPTVAVPRLYSTHLAQHPCRILVFV